MGDEGGLDAMSVSQPVRSDLHDACLLAARAPCQRACGEHRQRNGKDLDGTRPILRLQIRGGGLLRLSEVRDLSPQIRGGGLLRLSEVRDMSV